MFDIHLEASSDRFGKRYEEFLNKSRSNDIPKSSIEQSQLRALIDETRRDLEKCTNEIGCIDIAKVLEVQESLLAPIRTLPTEVMCFILHLVVSSGYHHGVIELTVDAEDGEFECKSEEISLLSKVCSRWREIIHSDPSFWSNIQLSGRVITKFFLPADFRAMSTCLEEVLLRSGTAVPMCLDVCFSSRSWCESDTVGLFPILDALAEQASRWREAKLSFTGTKPHLVHMLEQVRSRTTKFPKLENLRLYATNFDVFDPGFFGTMFSHCPRLHTLELSSFRSTDLFDLRHLTTLTIYTYFGSSFAALLEKCPRLEFFKLDHSVPGSESESSIPLTPLTVRHSHLARLDVEEISHSSLGFWQHVSLPELTCVRATIKGIEANRSAFDEFKEMLIESNCFLQDVTFIWYDNVLSDSVESLVQGMHISEPHVHFVRSNESWDNNHQKYLVIPPNTRCIYCLLDKEYR